MDKPQRLLRMILMGGVVVGAGPANADRLSDLEDQVRQLQESLTRIQGEVQAERARQASAATLAVPASPATLAVPASPAVRAVPAPPSAAPPPATDPAAWPAGYIPVPGTKTAVRFGGAVRAEMIDDLSSSQGGRTDDATAIPARGTAKANRAGALNGSISGSRLNVGALSRTEIGEVKTFVEFDLGAEVTPGFRLRHAYLATGDWLAGQTWTTFMDMDTVPDLLSAGGAVGPSWLRRAQVRYSLPAGSGGRVDVAAEMPSSDYRAPDALNRAPDLVLRYAADPSWGHYAVGGMVRYLRNDAGTGPTADRVVWGLLGGVGIRLFDTDLLTLQTVSGTGVGGVLNQGTGLSAALVGQSFRTVDTYGGALAYRHLWRPILRSTVAVGYDRFSNAAVNTGTNGLGIRSLTSVHGNLVYSPIESMDVGLEYGYEAFTASPSGSGSASRLIGVVKYGY